MSNKKGLGDRLAWLGGANTDVLDRVPTERARFIQMALVLLTTASIAVMSMMFALNDGVHVPFAAAVIGGLFWGFVILNLDRFLVLSMGHTRDWKRLVLMALPRLLLAAVISLVVATPMTLRIFQHDIDNAMVAAQAIESKQDSKLVQQPGPCQDQLGQGDPGGPSAGHRHQPGRDRRADPGEQPDAAGSSGSDRHG
jgi:Domain of unknown function (DUF4407)